MKKTTIILLVAFLLCPSASYAAVRGDKAMYVGGTLTDIPEEQKGKMNLSGEDGLVFGWKKDKKEHQWQLPYSQITRMEYGQKAGRRVGVAIALSPLALFSKKRKHYVTIHFTDEAGNGQAAVFELGKKTYKTFMATMEARTGIAVEDTTQKESGKER